MAGLEPLSPWAEQCRNLLVADGISVVQEYEDDGGNDYFDAI